MHEYTQADKEILFRISKSFEHFAEMQGVDPDHHLIEVFESDEQTITVPAKDRKVLIAWVLWQLCFQQDRTLLWLKRGWRGASSVHEIVTPMIKLGKLAPFILRKNERDLELDNRCRLLSLAMTPSATKGMAISHIVIEGAVIGSKLWDDLMLNIMPVMRFGARLIILEKEFDVQTEV